MNLVPDGEKTKEQLIAELEALRGQVSTLQQRLALPVQECPADLSKPNQFLATDIAKLQQAEAQLRELNSVVTQAQDAAERQNFSSITADCSEQQSNRVWQHSEELFRSLSACSPVGIFLTDIEGRCIYTNPRYQAICGITEEESLGEEWTRSLQPEDREWVFTHWMTYSREGHEYSDEFRLLAPTSGLKNSLEQRVRWVHVQISPLIAAPGKLIGHVGTVEDITEHKQSQEELLISDTALRQMPDAILLTDLQGNLLKWLGNAEQIFGYSAEEVIGKPVNFLHRPDIREKIATQMIHSIQETGEFLGEVPCIKKDGSEILIETTSKPVYDKTGKPIFFVEINRDITERKQAETERTQLIREQTARLEAELAQKRSTFLAEASKVLASSLDYEITLKSVAQLAVPTLADWCVVDILEEDGSLQRLATAHINPAKVEWAWEIQRRYPTNLNAPRGIANVLRTGQSEYYPEILDDQLAQGARDSEHLRLLREAGLKSVMIVPLLARGRSLGTISLLSAESDYHYSAADLSLAEELANRAALALDNAKLYQEAQRAKQAAEQAATRTARLQAVTAALSESLTPPQVAEVIVQQSTAALGANSALVTLLTESGTELEIIGVVGYPAESIEPWRRFPVDAPLPLSEAVRTGKVVWLETTESRAARYPHLKEIYARYNFKAWISIPLIVEGRVVGGMSLSFPEVPQLSQDDQAFILALTQQCAQAIERARLYEAERKARNAAESANRLKDEFLAIVSHELRTPLNSILGWSQILRQRQVDSATLARALEIIERNAKSQNQLIEDLLDISRIIRGKVSLNMRSIDLVAVIDAAIESVRLTAEANNIRIETQFDRSASSVLGDSDRLQQVVWNLLSNAVKFTPKGGLIKVYLQRINAHAQIQVTDTGIGIKPDFLPHVFESFRQADGSITRSHKGLGLGLAIVRQLVELHGGSVHAESQGEGRGATFMVKLPLQSRTEETELRTEVDVAPGSQSTQQERLRSPVASPSLKGLRVLVVDDELDNREFIAFILQQNGAEVTAVASAEEALQTLQQLQPDVLISDIGMPKEDGYTLIRKVRALEVEQGGSIPAIALTAYARAEDRQQALSAGFQEHIPKPVESAELVAAVLTLAGRTGKD